MVEGLTWLRWDAVESWTQGSGGLAKLGTGNTHNIFIYIYIYIKPPLQNLPFDKLVWYLATIGRWVPLVSVSIWFDLMGFSK